MGIFKVSLDEHLLNPHQMLLLLLTDVVVQPDLSCESGVVGPF